VKKCITILFFCRVIVAAQLPYTPADGGGEAPLSFDDVISPEQRTYIFEEIRANELNLKNNGKWPATFGTKEAIPALEFPLTWNTGFSDYGFYGISAYADHNVEFPNVVTYYQ